MVTLIDAEVAPVLHNNEPGAVVVNVEIPQLFTTFIEGLAGGVPGAAIALPRPLVQPFTVVLTV